MLGSTECVVSFGSDIKLQWTQVRDGSINLSIRLIAGASRPQERRKKTLVHHTESCENSDRTIRFQLALKDHPGDRYLKQLRTGGLAIEAEDEEDGQGSQGSQQDEINSVATNVSCEVCRKICGKIEKEFGKRRNKIRECLSLWMESPGEFFGNTTFISSEQWSFRALTDSEKKLDQERAPLHKVNLAYHLQKRMEESKLPELNCRKTMLQEIYPGFEKMGRKEREPLYRRFERYIEQGQALIFITTRNDGILLLVTGVLSRADLAHLSKDWKTCACRFLWLSPGILEQSRQYEGVTRTILTYMQPKSKRRATEHDQDSRQKRLRLEFPGNRVAGQSYSINGPPLPRLPSQRSSLSTPQSCQDFVAGKEQATESYSPTRESSSLQIFSITSTPSTTESQQSPVSTHINYKAFEQPVASAQDPNPSYNIQPETYQTDQELSTGLQPGQRHQQSKELVPYSTQHAAVDTSALEAPHFGESADNPGPQLQLPTQRKVPDTAQSIQFAMKGDIDGLKSLFSQGLASPRDVSNSRGFSLVRWALYGGMCNYKTIQFLLSLGAFVDEDSYQHAWDYAYRKKCSVTELYELRCITLNPPSTYTYRDWTEEQQFPLIHNIIFGRSSKLLRAELDDNPDAVRVTDAMGRTALDWATALAQLSDMRLLIDRGSPLNTMDVSGRTTVLHAVDSHNDNALRIALEAGANPNPEVPNGLFRSSPLTAASFGGLVGMIKLLIKFGAKVDACNPEGWTALQVVASMQNAECADILLTYGADLDYISSNGHSPLTTAIMYNNHAVLKLFIDRCDTGRLKGLQLLPIIAASADAGTMSILAPSDLLKQTLLNEDGFAAGRETLRSRTDYDKGLDNAFEDLCRQGQRGGSRLPDGGRRH